MRPHADTPVLLIGYGYASRVLHAPLIAQTPGLRLAAAISSSADKVQADWPGLPVFSTLDQAFEDLPSWAGASGSAGAGAGAHPDDSATGSVLAVIATPNETHAALASRALRRGCHVVVDKPFTVTLAQARALCTEAVQHQRLLSVFHNRRWDGDFLALQSAIAAGEVGPVHLLQSRFDRFRPQIRPRWREQAVPGGGIWCDLGPHLIDQALVLFGLPDAVQANIRTLRPGAVVDDHFDVTLLYPHCTVQLGASMLLAGGLPRFAVHGARGSWVKTGLDGQETRLLGQPAGPETLIQVDGNGTTTTLPLPAGDYPHYYRALVAALQDNGCNPVSALEACAVMAVLDAGQRAAQSGQRAVPDFIPEERAVFRPRGWAAMPQTHA